MFASDGSEYVELRWANGKYAGEPVGSICRP
jgi:hypothetical protein